MALLLAHLWRQLSHDAQSKGGASSTQTFNTNMVVPQTRDIRLALGGNRLLLLQGHPDMSLRGSMGKDLAMLPGDITSYSHPAVRHHFPVLSLFFVHTPF